MNSTTLADHQDPWELFLGNEIRKRVAINFNAMQKYFWRMNDKIEDHPFQAWEE